MTPLTHVKLKKDKCVNSLMGFTLVETLVAVTLLLLVIVGPMSIASRGIRSAYFAGDQTTAVFLAQEAIEHIQGLRDDNALANFNDYQSDGNDEDGNTWSWYVSGPSGASNWDACKASSGCDVYLRAIGPTYKNCGTPSACRLNQYTGGSPNSVIRAYSHELIGPEWSESPYTRTIVIGGVVYDSSFPPKPLYVPVTVTVSWESSLFGSSRSVILETALYNHYARYE